MFAHYVVIVDEATNVSVVIGSSVPVDVVQWPRIVFSDGSIYNQATGAIKSYHDVVIAVLRPGEPAYISPIALGQRPPRGAQVTLISRSRNGTILVSRPGRNMRT